LEGLVNGLPCITTQWDGAAEKIENGKNGFVLAEPTDIQQLADRVNELRDAQIRRRMSEQARTLAGSVSMSAHAEAMMELYQSLPGPRCDVDSPA
jgi:glycosyltransferase involved in cell wall biosynthesis